MIKSNVLSNISSFLNNNLSQDIIKNIKKDTTQGLSGFDNEKEIVEYKIDTSVSFNLKSRET